MGVFMFHNLVFDGRVISILGVIFDLPIDLRILREDTPQQELLRQSKCLHFCHRNVHKLSLDIVAQVVVAEE